MLTFVFVNVAVLLVWSVAAYTNGAINLNQLAFPDSQGGVYSPKSWLPLFLLAIGLVIIGLGLKFMWDVRHPKATG